MFQPRDHPPLAASCAPHSSTRVDIATSTCSDTVYSVTASRACLDATGKVVLTLTPELHMKLAKKRN